MTKILRYYTLRLLIVDSDRKTPKPARSDHRLPSRPLVAIALSASGWLNEVRLPKAPPEGRSHTSPTLSQKENVAVWTDE